MSSATTNMTERDTNRRRVGLSLAVVAACLYLPFSWLLRAVLIEASHRLMRFDPRWLALGQSLKSRGKPACVTAAAIANRWVRWLYHQLLPLAL